MGSFTGGLMNKVFFGDCRKSIQQMISNGIKAQMCVTSPPYYGLRDYGHINQIGLEQTPEEYIKAIVAVFRLIKELLKDDGVIWVNIGDSYAGSGKGSNPDGTPHQSTLKGKQGTNTGSITGKHFAQKAYKIGLKPKDLIGIPWMLAFALRADGWYLRQDIIWSKPNPMPESVKDRCTKAHEYIFLLSKSGKYYFDNTSIQEKTVYGKDLGLLRSKKAINGANAKKIINGRTNEPNARNIEWYRNKRSVWTVNTKPYSGAHFAVFPKELIEPCILAGSRVGDTVIDPFFGSGTTGQVCQELGRQWIGCELNEGYKKLQEERLAQFCMEI